MTFEEKIKQLEKITEDLAGGGLSLEDSVKQFEKGVKLSRECEQALNKSEEKVKLLINIDENNEVHTKDFK